MVEQDTEQVAQNGVESSSRGEISGDAGKEAKEVANRGGDPDGAGSGPGLPAGGDRDLHRGLDSLGPPPGTGSGNIHWVRFTSISEFLKEFPE
jgi:hypothetical protein